MLSQSDIFRSRGYNVPTFIIGADGKRIDIETREDEEQRVKYEQILTVLVRAGYFRAKIKGINPFDVVVGGMTWCIDTSDLDLDIDLLFEEGLNTGQKIALTEKIVVVLPKIKCPFFIEPHQIQGLDFIHIFPVIEWLINWSSENRRQKAEFLAEYAKNQFHKRFIDPPNERFRLLKGRALKNIKFVIDKYQPPRVLKQTNLSSSNLSLKVEGTLAEYGLSKLKKGLGYSIGPNVDLKFKKEEVQSLLAGLSKEDCSQVFYLKNIQHLLNTDFESLEIERKIQRLKAELEKLGQEKSRLEEAKENAAQETTDISSKLEEKTLEVETLTEEERKTVKKLQTMIQEHEVLKENEKNYKETCKTELINLETEIGELENGQVDEELAELNLQFELLRNKLEKKKLELGKLTRSVILKERIVEEVPSRAELAQYQKRFTELYHQVDLKTNETKRYIILFNTLNDRFVYMEKEFNILNSIQDSYAQVISSGIGGAEFLRQFRGIAAGIEQAKKKTIEKCEGHEKIKEKMHEHLLLLQKQKSEYVVAVKKLADMYKTNERLMVLLKKLSKRGNRIIVEGVAGPSNAPK